MTAPIVLRDYQLDAVDGAFRALDEHQSTLIVAPTGCHVAGQPLLLHDGSVKLVEDVVVGDRLMGPDNKPRTVQSLARGEDDIFEVRPTKGAPWRVNRGHVLTLARTAIDRADARAGELVDVAVGDWLAWNKTARHTHKLLRVPVEFPSAPPLPLDPYFLGVLLGDGSVKGPTVSVCKPDPEIRAACYETAAVLGCGVSVQAEGTTSPFYRFTYGYQHHNPLVAILRTLGLMGLGGAAKFVPQAYKVASVDDRLRLLAGLIDTDGHLESGGYDWISVSPRLADDLAFVARSVGLAAYVQPCRKGCQTGAVGDYYRVSISGDCARVPCRIPRRKAQPRAQKKSVLRTGIAVVDCGYRAPYFGFTLDGDGRYLLGDFTVTHNSGKTTIFSSIIRRWLDEGRGRVLVTAHRTELITQAVERLATQEGIRAGIERNVERASLDDMVVVGMMQTLASAKRRKRYAPGHFSLVIIDEGHHAAAASHRAILAHFPAAKRIGVTATPDRGDKVRLSPVFASVAHRYEIRDAIAAGHLVPIRQVAITVAGLDLSRAKTKAGDLADGDVESALLAPGVLEDVAAGIIRAAGPRKTIAFTPTKATAHLLAAQLNRLEPDSARALDGDSDKDVRRQTLRDYRAGLFTRLVNCALFTEGFDEPSIECVAIVRPTKSRAFFVQMAGRGMRPSPSTGKRDVLLLDFRGNAGKHTLMCPFDVLGGNADEPTKAKAAAKCAADPDLDILAALDEATREITEERRQEIIARARYSAVEVDPFTLAASVLDAPLDGLPPEGNDAPDPADLEYLRICACGLRVAGMTAAQVARIAASLRERAAAGLSTWAQARTLARAGLDADVDQRTAARTIEALLANRWQSTPAIRADHEARR